MPLDASPGNGVSSFPPTGYDLQKLIDNPKRHIVKVPYAWDFGFLMLHKNAFTAKDKPGIPHVQFGRLENAGNKLSWIDLAEWLTDTSEDLNMNQKEPPLRQRRSSKENQSLVPQTPYIPFALAPEAQETLSCLFLEIWVSQIESANAEQTRKLFPVSRDEDTPEKNLAELIDKYKKEAILTLLVLMTLIDDQDINSENEYTQPKARIPLAYRSWYSASSEIASGNCNKSESEPSSQPADKSNTVPPDTIASLPHYYPARLPGTRSVRGDWFLAIARGSRSYQMGERAIDLLSTRRANIVRLQKGVGLPVRDTHDVDASELWTNLKKCSTTEDDQQDAHGIQRLMYHELLQLGSDEPNSGKKPKFEWLWRSRIRYYDRHARLLRRWLCSVLGPTHSDLRKPIIDRPFETIRNLDAMSTEELLDGNNDYSALVEVVSRFVDSLKRAVVTSVEDQGE